MDTSLLFRVENFFTQYKLLTYKKGEVLFRAEDTPPGVYYVKDGFVKQYIISLEGNELILHIYGPHSFFPMMWALGDIPNEHFYAALTPATTFRAPKDTTLQFLHEHPEVIFDLTKRLFHGIDGLLKRIEHLSLGTAHSKVISVLLYLAKHFGEKKGKGIIIIHKFTHHDIASLVGTVRETTTRELENLMKEGVITYENHSLVITDIRKLHKLHTITR